MKILYLCHRIPYPPNKGDKIRSFHEIKYLSERHDVYLACLVDDPDDVIYTTELEKLCKTVDVVLIKAMRKKLKSLLCLPSDRPLSVAYFYSDELQKLIDRRIATTDFDVIFCFSSSMAEYLFKSKTELASRVNRLRCESGSVSAFRCPKLIMDFVDADSDKWRQYSRYAPWPFSWIYRLEGRRLADYEVKVADLFDGSVFITTKEADFLKNRNLKAQDRLIMPNGVDFSYFSSSRSASSDDKHYPTLLFTGAMDYYANIDGVRWFAEEILPDLVKRFPALMFYIVGRNPAKAVKALAGEHIRVTGYVEDIRSFYELATIYVAPLRMARGIQNKILEAMSMGRAVVSTSKAFEGIEALPGKDLLLADSKEDFTSQIGLLLKDTKKRQSIGESARRTIEEKYSWERSLRMLETFLTSRPRDHEVSPTRQAG